MQQSEIGDEIDGECRFEFGRRQFADRLFLAEDAGIAKEPIEPAEALRDQCREAIDIIYITHFADDRSGFAP